MIDYNKLDAIIREKGMSRREFARENGININTMSAWFRRRTDMPVEAIKDIARILGIRPAQIIRDDVLELLKGWE